MAKLCATLQRAGVAPSGAVGALLAMVLATAAVLWAPAAGELHLGSDDRQLMAVSRDLAAGRWDRLLDPQLVHVFPLFRLLRLWGDLTFPGGFLWLHAVAVAAHLASVVLLFALCRRFLASAWASLATAALFAWNALGTDAFIIKSQNPYVLVVPFLLGGLLCLLRMSEGGGRRWAVGGGLSLLAAAGFHVTLAIPSIPAVFVAWHLLSARRRRRAAWLACAAPWVTAGWLWLDRAGAGSIWQTEFHSSPWRLLARLGEGLAGTVLHFGFLVRHGQPAWWVMAASTTALALLLWRLRKDRRLSWLVAALLLAALPAWLTLTARGAGAHQLSRYCYQSFLAVAVAVGVAVDLSLTHRGRRRVILAALLIAAAPGYYIAESRILEQKTRLLRFNNTVRREFWLGWCDFFRQARPGLRVPPLPIEPSLLATEVVRICAPRGLPGVVLLDAAGAGAGDCEEFRRLALESGRIAIREPAPCPGR